MYGKISYLKNFGDKSEKSPDKSKDALRKAPEKSAAEISFYTVLYSAGTAGLLIGPKAVAH